MIENHLTIIIKNQNYAKNRKHSRLVGDFLDTILRHHWQTLEATP